MALLFVPPGHGTGVAAPSTQKKPRGQTLHAVAPVSSWYEPAAQSEHAPTIQVAALVPTGQTTHSKSLFDFVESSTQLPRRKWPLAHVAKSHAAFGQAS